MKELPHDPLSAGPEPAAGPGPAAEEGAWPLQPMDPAERAGLVDAALVFAKGLAGGVATLFGVGALLIPNLVEARGATRSHVLEKQRRERCMELGVTLEELAAIERGEAPPPPPQDR